MQFTYRARQDPRTEASGVIEAIDLSSAVAHLRRMGLYPIELVPLEKTADGAPLSVAPSKNPLSRTSLALWARTLSQGLAAGLTLTRALHLLTDQEAHREIGKAARLLEQNVTEGMSLADSMQQFGNSFTPVAIHLVRAGEASGALEPVLQSFAVQMESEADLIAQVRGALIYPLFVLTIGVGTVMVLMCVVVPKLAVLFAETGQPLPWTTQLLVQSSHGLIWGFGFFFLIVVGIAWIVRRRGLTHLLGLKLLAMFSRIPFLGRLIVHAEVARLSSTIGLLLQHGLPLPESLRLAADTVGEPRLKDQIKRCERFVIEGMSLSECLRRVGMEEPFLLTMVAMGEVQGDLARSFSQAAARYRQEVDRTVKILSSLIEPIMILVVGLIVGGIVFSMLLPIFQLNFTVG